MSDTTDKKVVPLRRSDLMSIVLGNKHSEDEQERLQYTPHEERAILARINREHAVVLDRGGSSMILAYDVNPATGRVVYNFWKQDQFLVKYMNETVQIGVGDKIASMEMGKWWLRQKERRMYTGICYDPEHIEKDQWGAHVKEGKLNLWTGFGVEARKGDWKRIMYHCYAIICKRDRVKFKYLIKWMAWGIQNPGKAAGTAIVIRGKKGTGKSVLGNLLCKIFGTHSSVLTNSEHLTGKFNAHLETSSFVFSDEAYYPDNESDGVLKGIITEPFFTVEAKYQTPRVARNTLKVIMCTNYERAVNASVDERRYFVCETDDRYSPTGMNKSKGEAYFGKIYDQVRNDGASAMMYDLLNMDLGDFSPIWHMPRTSELERQVFLGIRNWDRVVYEFLQAGFFPGKPNMQVNASDLLEYMQRTFPLAKSIRDMKLYTESLLKTGAIKRRSPTGNVYVFLPLNEARKKWEEKNGRPPEPWELNEDGSEKWIFRLEFNETKY